MRSSMRFAAVVATALLVAGLMPTIALAAEEAPLMDAWGAGAISVLDLDAGKEPTYVVSLQFTEEYTEPPEGKVAVPIPDDAVVIWAGEVLSADPSQDITARDLETLDIDGQSYAVFTVTKSSRVQVECSVPPEVLSGDASRSEVNISFTALSDMVGMQLAVVAPRGSRAEEVPEGVETTPIDSGTAYVLNEENLKTGTTVSLEVALVPGMPVLDDAGGAEASQTPGAEVATGSADATGTAGTSRSYLPFIIGGLLVAMVVAIVVLVLVRNKETGADEPEATDEGETADEPDTAGESATADEPETADEP